MMEDVDILRRMSEEISRKWHTTIVEEILAAGLDNDYALPFKKNITSSRTSETEAQVTVKKFARPIHFGDQYTEYTDEAIAKAFNASELFEQGILRIANQPLAATAVCSIGQQTATQDMFPTLGAIRNIQYAEGSLVPGIDIVKDELRFNGSPISDVISYDETTGDIHYYERHWSSGDLIPDSSDSTGYRTGKDKGKIEVVTRKSPTGSNPTNPCDNSNYDNNCQPWYPYGCPGFCETAKQVSFKLDLFLPIAVTDNTGMWNTSSRDIAVLDNLVVDGVDLGDNWVLIEVKEVGADLKLAFVKLSKYRGFGSHSIADKKDIDYLGLVGKASVAMGYPHIYKIVSIDRGCFSPACSLVVKTGNIREPRTWPSGVNMGVTVGDSRYFSYPSPLTLEVLQKLC